MGYIYSDGLEAGGSGTMESAANFSALPPFADHANESFFVEASEGTPWLPGSLGGSYYPRGVYFSNGIEWIYQENPGQATQSEVNAGLVTDKFIAPNTFQGSTKILNSFQKNVDDTDDITEGLKKFLPVLPNDALQFLNGLGSFSTPLGAPLFPPNFLYQNVKVIQTLADFPAPIGNEIFLEDKTYLIDAIKLDVGNKTLVFGRRTAIKGFNQNVSSLKSTVAGHLFFKGGANMFINEIEIFCSANNQQVFECISDGSVPDGTSFEINLFAAYCLDDNDAFTTGCKIGFIKDIRQGFIGTQFYFGFADGFELAGYWTDGGWRVENTLFRAFAIMGQTGKAFYSSPTDPVTFEARFASNANLQINGTSVGYDFPETSFTYDGQYQLQDGNLSGTGTFVADFASGFPAFSTRSNFAGNTGIQNTFQGGEWITTGDNITTITTANVWYQANLVTSNKFLTWFTELNGVFTYDADTPLDVSILVTMTLTGKANDVAQVKILKETALGIQTDVLIRTITIAGSTVQGRAESVPIISTDMLESGDMIKIFIRNTSGTSDITTLSN